MNQDPNNAVAVQPTTQPVLPPEPQAPAEEPVMMVANIDEAPQGEAPAPVIPAAPAEPVEPTTDLPVAGPDLGQPNQPEAETETVPTFQQLGEVPIEGAEPTPVVDESPATVPDTLPPVVNPVETGTPETEPEQVPTFQQLAEVPVEGASSPMAMEEVPTGEEEEEGKKKPKKAKRIITILIVLVVLGLIGGGLSFALKSLNTLGKEDLIKTLKPVRSENSRTNLIILGTTAKRDETAVMLNAVYGSDESNTDCPEIEGRYLKYNSKKLVLKSKKAYHAYIPCDDNSKQRYLIDGDGNNTVDGAIIVVNAEEGLVPETISAIELLNKTGVPKVIVYVIGDKTAVETPIIEALDKNGFDSTYVPIINSTEVNEETIIQIMDKIDTTVKKVVDKKQNAAIQSFDKVELITYMKTPEEDGIADPMTKDSTLTIKADSKEIPVKVTMPEGVEALNPGEVALINITLEEKIPLEKTMRLKLYQNDSVVAIGVISDLK